MKAPGSGQRENLAGCLHDAWCFGHAGENLEKSGHVPGRAKRMTFLLANSLEAL